jgi:hypothetical protein
VDSQSLCDFRLCFFPRQKIPIAFFTVLGAVHDSQIAHWGRLFSKLDDVHMAPSKKCTVDSAFGKVNCPFFIKSLQDILVSLAPATQAQREDIQWKMQAILMRQATEWGMRSIQSSFPHLKDCFVYKEGGERQIVLKMIALLYILLLKSLGIPTPRNPHCQALVVSFVWPTPLSFPVTKFLASQEHNRDIPTATTIQK